MFTPDARLFETAEGHVGINHIVRIDPDCARVQALRYSESFADV
jgi:hypothetical protein